MRTLLRLRNLHTTRSTKHALDIAINRELAGCQCTHHEQPRRQTRKRAPEAQLARNLDQSAHGALARQTLGLVDFAQHGISGLGDDGGGETCDQAGAEVHGGVGGVGSGGFVDEVLEDGFGGLFVDDEFGHCVGDSAEIGMLSGWPRCIGRKGGYVLLEKNRAKARVERPETLRLRNLAESADQS